MDSGKYTESKSQMNSQRMSIATDINYPPFDERFVPTE